MFRGVVDSLNALPSTLSAALTAHTPATGPEKVTCSHFIEVKGRCCIFLAYEKGGFQVLHLPILHPSFPAEFAV